MKKALYQKLDERDATGEDDNKVVILHGFSPMQLRAVVNAYRSDESLPQNVAFGIMTEESAQRTLGDVVADLQEDAAAAKTRKSLSRKKT